MDCKDFERLIPEFLCSNMNYSQMEAFREHMDKCESCKEELSIQFLVAEGMRHLEDDGAFDLQIEMERRLAQNSLKIDRHNRFILVRRYFMTALFSLLGVFLLYLFG
jgi:hypothetical protein